MRTQASKRVHKRTTQAPVDAMMTVLHLSHPKDDWREILVQEDMNKPVEDSRSSAAKSKCKCIQEAANRLMTL